MRLMHLADLHIGKIVNGFSMLEDQAFVLGEVLRTIEEREVQALLIAGDIYDKSSPSAEAVALFDDFLTQLAQAGVAVLAVPGNHDSAERIAYAQDILRRQQVYFPPVYEGEITKVDLPDEHGTVSFWLMPFLKPAMVRRYHPDMPLGTDYTQAIRTALESCSIDPKARNVLVAHQFVTAGGASTQRAAEEIDLGGVENVDAGVFDAFDYVALGHVHRPQRLGRETLRYAGSPLKYSFSEIRYPKSAVVVEIGRKEPTDQVGQCAKVELVPLPCLHDMREIKGPLEELVRPEVVSSAPAADYLHVILTDETPVIDAMAKVRAAYPNVMTLDYDYALKAAAEAGLLPTAPNPEELDPGELFEGFFQEQAGHELSKEQSELVNRLFNTIREETVTKGGE